MKSAQGLVEYVKAQVGKPYWFGTFGNKASSSLWTSKSKQYPSHYTADRKAKAQSQYGQKVHDCAGLIKGYMWSDSADAPAKYNAKEDLSADAMYDRAKTKGEIKFIPERSGVAVWRKGHIGVYIGNGKVVEAKGFNYGVVVSDLKGSTFTHWLEIPNIDYSASNKQVSEQPKTEAKPQPTAPTTSTSASNTYTVKSGDTLWGIASKYLGNGSRYPEIMTLNKLSHTLIRVGQVLKLPKR